MLFSGERLAKDGQAGRCSTDGFLVPASSSNNKHHFKSSKVLPRRIVIIPVDEKDKQCGCGKEKTFIRYEIKEKLDYKPATFEIVEEKREVLGCPVKCEKSVVMACAPKRILPKVPVTEDLLAHVILSKFDDRQPLYKLGYLFYKKSLS